MSTKSNVLKLLIQQPNEAVSGEEIAKKLKVSRTAIWKAINELKKDGHQIESNGNKGYSYSPTDILSIEGIQAKIAAHVPPLTIQLLNSSESTMKDAKMAGLNGTPENTLIVANNQEAPKGRFGRPFFSKENCGIYMTILLKPNKNFDDIAQYTIIMAVAVSKAIDRLTNRTTEIKWVNDIYLDGKKVCGILSEATSDVESGQISSVTIGMGINFSIQTNEFPKDIRNKATSIFPDTPPTISRNDLIAEIWNQFYKIVESLPSKDFLDSYREKSFILGKNVSFIRKERTYCGKAEAINEQGELIVALENGEKMTLSSGEISLSSY